MFKLYKTEVKKQFYKKIMIVRSNCGMIFTVNMTKTDHHKSSSVTYLQEC